MQTEELHIVYSLSLALALGLIIGVEREWRDRDFEGGRRPAGVRSFGLIALSGGVAGFLGKSFEVFPSIGLVLVIGIMMLAYWRRSQGADFMGVTTIFAAFIAYACGIQAATGHPVPASATAIVTAIMLSAKERLHKFVARLDQKEIFAALQFLLIAGVVLPLAPNKNLGPYDAINPFEIWLMVVLVCGLSFLGYASTRLLSPRRGIIGTAVLGGIVSSTATTLSFARIAKNDSNLVLTLSAGIVLASSIMFARVLIMCGLIWPPLLSRLGVALGAMVVTSGIISVIIVNRQSKVAIDTPPLTNPLEIIPAVIFAGLLAVVMLASRWVEASFGAEGVYVVAFASGLADVDAITLSLSRFARDGLAVNVATTGIFIASVTNTLVKTGLIAIAGGGRLFQIVSAALVMTIIAGAIVFVLT